MLRSRTCIINYKKHIKLSNEKKNPRRCATLAANKIKIMSDTKEELSSSESVYTVKKNRRQLHGSVSTASRKKLISSSEVDGCLKSENEKEQLSGRKKLSCPESSAPKRKYISESENEKTESEAERKVTQQNSNYSQARKTVCAVALKNLEYDSSEDNSTNHKMENGRNWRSSSQSASAHNHCTSNSEEEVDTDLAKHETKSIQVSNRKTRASFKRSKLLDEFKESSESETGGKKDEKSSASENVEAPGTAGSSKASFNCSSDSDSGTDNSIYSDATETRKRKRKSEGVRKEINNSNSLKPPRRPQRRKRWKPNQENDSEDLDYTKYRRANRRSKIRTRNGGRRTVRYDDCDDDDDDRGLDDVDCET